jgi:hypothetical protein
MYSWKNYNQKNERLINQFRKYNNKHKLNLSERSYYNHTRDFFALNLISKKKIKVLDYGSNFLACSNLDNKIDCKNINYFLFNPFLKKIIINKKFGKLKVKCFKNLKTIKKQRFDIINFGSSLQYMENFDQIIKSLRFKAKSTILISATPITFNKTYKAKQTNAKKLDQKVYSFYDISKILKKKKFKNIFKSCMDFKLSGLKKKNKTYFMNLVFAN